MSAGCLVVVQTLYSLHWVCVRSLYDVYWLSSGSTETALPLLGLCTLSMWCLLVVQWLSIGVFVVCWLPHISTGSLLACCIGSLFPLYWLDLSALSVICQLSIASVLTPSRSYSGSMLALCWLYPGRCTACSLCSLPMTAYSLSMHCLFTAYTLPIHCLFTAYSLPTAYSVSIHCLFTAYSLPIHCLFTAYSLPIHAYSLPIHCLFTAYSLPIHCLFTAYSLPIHSNLCTVSR
jgi:hypothetical protein